MGQRSQIFVRYEENGQKKMIARYYQWNYGERMISRARYGIEWLKDMYKYTFEFERKLYRILDTNFDMIDCVISSDIIKEFIDGDWENDGYTLNNFMFYQQDNNDGKLFIDVLSDGTIKYAFLDYNNKKIMSGTEYMKWNRGKNWKNPTEYFDQEDVDICIKNIKIYNKTEPVLARFGLLPSLLEPFYGIILSESSCFRLSGKAVWVYPAPPAAGLKNRHVPVGHLHMERRQNRGRAGSRDRRPQYCSGPYRPGFRCAISPRNTRRPFLRISKPSISNRPKSIRRRPTTSRR